MTKAQKAVIQAQFDAEKKVIRELEQVYRQALKDVDARIRRLSMRSDMEPQRVQTIIYQRRYQEAIKAQLEDVLEKLHTQEYMTVSEYLDQCYRDGYIGVVYDLQGQGIPLILPIDQEQVTQAIQVDSKLSRPLYESMGEDVNKLKTSVRAEVSRGIVNGSSWNDVAAKIAKSMKHTPFQRAFNRALNIARTEGHRIQTAAALDAQRKAKAAGANVVKQWNSTLDGDTRETHRVLDGQIREIEEDFEVDGKRASAPGHFGDPAEDCNCRCVLCQRAKWALDEDELKSLQERAEFYGLDKTKDFEEFKRKYLDACKEALEKSGKRFNILSTDEAINKAKQFGDDIVRGKDKLVFDNGNPIFDYVARRLNYDVQPKTADPDSFSEMAKDSPVGILYRGIFADTREKAMQYANEFMHGKMYAGKSYAYGSGTYFSPNKNEAEKYNNQGLILKAALDPDAKIVKYKDIIKEYSSTGADVARLKKGDNTEAWEDILSTVSEFASIKGYDAISMDGALGQNHVIILNRGKVIIEK